MSALVMALVAGMAVGNGPERVSTATDPGLGIGGCWELTWKQTRKNGDEQTSTMYLVPGFIVRDDGPKCPCRVVDEGKGRCRIILRERLEFLGIYKHERGSLLICIGPSFLDSPAKNRPDGISPRPEKYESLLILRRIKPPK
jgi:hypothetical protein